MLWCVPTGTTSRWRWNVGRSGDGDHYDPGGDQDCAADPLAAERLAQEQDAEGCADDDAEFAGGRDIRRWFR